MKIPSYLLLLISFFIGINPTLTVSASSQETMDNRPLSFKEKVTRIVKSKEFKVASSCVFSLAIISCYFYCLYYLVRLESLRNNQIKKLRQEIQKDKEASRNFKINSRKEQLTQYAQDVNETKQIFNQELPLYQQRLYIPLNQQINQTFENINKQIDTATKVLEDIATQKSPDFSDFDSLTENLKQETNVFYALIKSRIKQLMDNQPNPIPPCWQ